MDHLSSQPPDDTPLPPGGELILSISNTELAHFASATEVATMRNMMEALFARMETLQQNHAVQFAGVHDRLDAVELELPLIQEQSALRMQDLEGRITAQIEETAKSAAEEATAGLHEQVSGKFGSLEAQIEQQRSELAQMRASKEAVESRLSRAVSDIERLCGTLETKPPDPIERPIVEQPPSPFRSRIAEHIRKAALDAAPDDSNPLLADPAKRPSASEINVPPSPVLAQSAVARTAGVPLRVEPPTPVNGAPPGFDDWKRQFMQAGDPLVPSLTHEGTDRTGSVICPRCFSDRTRPATRTKLDGLFRLTGFSPHRCRSCAHRFYKRGGSSDSTLEGSADSRGEEALEA
jgi:hypothetical protein